MQSVVLLRLKHGRIRSLTLLLSMQASLQEFAWTERPRDQILAERASQCSTHAQREAAFAEPVFCFETACKALYWSILVYRLQARPFAFSNVSALQRQQGTTCAMQHYYDVHSPSLQGCLTCG